MLVNNECHFSKDRKYRYTLLRVWDQDLPTCMFLCLNPSTADEFQDDPTIRRCINFAKDWGYGSLYMGNIFAYRATDPKDMKKQDDPVGDENNYYLNYMAARSELIVAAWGNHGIYQNRARDIKEDFKGRLKALRITKQGEPYHPLYLPKSSKPIEYQ